MKHINKGDIPQEFISFVEKKRPSLWNEIHNQKSDVYGVVCDSLMEEQNGLCGYTELPLREFNRHIDHYRTRNLFPEREMCYGWNNLIFAANDDSFGARFKDEKLRDKEIYDEIFNPVVDEPQDYFEYNYFGEIKPKVDIQQDLRQKALKTIEIFNLNDNSLKNKRRVAAIAVEESFAGGLTKDQVKDYLKSVGFVSIIEQFTK